MKNPDRVVTSQKKWAYYDMMSFLIPHLTPRNLVAETTPAEIAPGTILKETLDIEGVPQDLPVSIVQEAPTLGLAIDQQTLGSASVTPRRRGSAGNFKTPKRACRGTAAKIAKESSVAEETDSDRLFLLSLLPLMKQLSPADNIDIRIEIHEAFRRRLFKPPSLVQDNYWVKEDHPIQLASPNL